MVNAIITENQNAGSSGWNFTNGATQEVQAYLDKSSYNPGDTLTAYVSTQATNDNYNVTIYRIGWYGGLGGRQIHQDTAQVGTNQGYYNGTSLVSCPTAIIDSTTHRVEAGWASSYTYALPNNLTTGWYMALFTNTTRANANWGCMFAVKGSPTSDYVIIIPTNTDQAYNAWGSYSLYAGSPIATNVSYLRPVYDLHGVGAHGFQYGAQFVHWAEGLGYDLSYITDVDLHENASLLLNHKVFISVAHHEYWSKPMYDGAQAAIASGCSAAFMGANACYWQVRFGTDSTGTLADKTVVGYKVMSNYPTDGNGPLSNDPLYGVNNTLVTTQWRATPVNLPENAMIGIMYSAGTTGIANNTGWTTDPSMDTTYTAGTSLVANTTYGTDIEGYEWDKIQSGSPGGLKTIATTATLPKAGGNDTANTTWYRAPAGGLVFASGSICFAWALSGYRWSQSMTYKATVPQVQVLMQNIMGAMKGSVWKGF